MQLSYETENLRLLIGNESFADLITDYLSRNREDFTRWDRKYDDNCFTHEYQVRAVKAEMRLFMQEEGFRYYLFQKGAPDRVIGNVSFSIQKAGIRPICEIGYKADKDYRGKGYTYEAASFLIQKVIEEFNPIKLFAEILPENRPSLALIQKLGFRFESIRRKALNLDGHPRDALLYILPIAL